MLEPLPPQNFTPELAAHLLNRAGFGGTPGEVDSFYRLGLPRAVDFLVHYERTPETYPDPSWSVPDPQEVAQERAFRRAPESPEKNAARKAIFKTYAQRQMELHQWWLERMRTTARPLQEKMTLFWHSLFATSVTKVRNPLLMWKQNQTFRERATGNWSDILVAMAKDPAMLIWLDGNSSRKEAPNENFAREVMELFTLGEGHYTEQDIKESARAYAGWHADPLTGEFHNLPKAHDYGEKTYLGQSGRFSGDDVLRILANEPRSAEYVSGRIWRYFASEEPNPTVTNALAAQLRGENLEFKPVLRSLFLSRAFYDPAVVRQQVKGPVQWLVSSCRYLERPLPPPILTLQMMRRLGQVVFNPPNVKGWDTGVSWITTNTLLDRYNFAALLVQGEPLGFGGGGKPKDRQARIEKMMEQNPMAGEEGAKPGPLVAVQVDALFSPAQRNNADALLQALEQRCIQAPLAADRVASLKSYMGAQDLSNPQTVLGAIRLLMSTPDYQLT